MEAKPNFFKKDKTSVDQIAAELSRLTGVRLSVTERMGNSSEIGFDDQLVGYDIRPKRFGVFKGTPIASFIGSDIVAYDPELVAPLQGIAATYLGQDVEVKQEEFGRCKYNPTDNEFLA